MVGSCCSAVGLWKEEVLMRPTIFTIALYLCAFNASAESVYVKYRGAVDLTPFVCAWIQRSSFINRLCYDPNEQYVVILLKSTYYHYCGVPGSVVSKWTTASSMGRFYNAYIKSRYDCRVNYMPAYGN